MRLILKWIRVIEALYLSLYNSKRHNRKKRLCKYTTGFACCLSVTYIRVGVTASRQLNVFLSFVEKGVYFV